MEDYFLCRIPWLIVLTLIPYGVRRELVREVLRVRVISGSMAASDVYLGG